MATKAGPKRKIWKTQDAVEKLNRGIAESKAKIAQARAERRAKREEGRIREAARKAAGWKKDALGYQKPTEKQKREAQEFEEKFRKRLNDEFYRDEYEKAHTAQQRREALTKSKYKAVLEIIAERYGYSDSDAAERVYEFETAYNIGITNDTPQSVEEIVEAIARWIKMEDDKFDDPENDMWEV